MTVVPFRKKMTYGMAMAAYRQAEAKEELECDKVRAEIDRFASDPEHPFFDEVREDMARLILAGLASNLPDAYAKALLIHEIRRN